MGAEAIQVHPTPPGFWGSPKLDEVRISTFKEAAAKHGNPPFYFHAVYLINLAGDDPAMRQRSELMPAGYLKGARRARRQRRDLSHGIAQGRGLRSAAAEHRRAPEARDGPGRSQGRAPRDREQRGPRGCVGARFEETAVMLASLGDLAGICLLLITCTRPSLPVATSGLPRMYRRHWTSSTGWWA